MSSIVAERLAAQITVLLRCPIWLGLLAPLGRLPIAFIVPRTLGVATLRDFVEKVRSSAKPLRLWNLRPRLSAQVIIGEVLMKNTGIKALAGALSRRSLPGTDRDPFRRSG